MRSLALCVCAFALIACSSENTGQNSAAIGPGGTHGSQGNVKGGGGGGGPVNGDCTYTQGYWKNHPSAWPVTSLVIGGVTYSEQQLIALFNDAPKGDASLILGHQLIAALLNVKNGAVPSVTVAQAINDAQTWMLANKGSNAGLPYGVSAGSAAGQQATSLTQTLDDFNSGLSGIPHCGDGSSSGSGSGSSSGGESSGSSSSGSSSSGGAPACVPLSGSCLMNSDCCSTFCNNGLCVVIVH
jgi:hypothetical protein